jgi:hypothetical protein
MERYQAGSVTYPYRNATMRSSEKTGNLAVLSMLDFIPPTVRSFAALSWHVTTMSVALLAHRSTLLDLPSHYGSRVRVTVGICLSK